MAREGLVPRRIELTDVERVTICTALQLEAARGRSRATSVPERARDIASAADYEDALASWLLGNGRRPRPPAADQGAERRPARSDAGGPHAG